MMQSMSINGDLVPTEDAEKAKQTMADVLSEDLVVDDGSSHGLPLTTDQTACTISLYDFDLEGRRLSISDVHCDDKQLKEGNSDDSDKLLRPCKAVESHAGLLTTAIVEFDRSDVSSDSEPDALQSQRIRFSKSYSKRRLRSMSEPLQSQARPNSPESVKTSNRRERRKGVSAEPVRVSWNRLKRTVEMQEPEISEIENAVNDSSDVKISSDVTELTPSQNVSDSWTQTTASSTPRCSLQQTSKSFDCGDQLVPSELVSDERVCTYLIKDDMELEKKFNGVVLGFRADHLALPRRLENQARARDVAESGMEKEIEQFCDGCEEISVLHPNEDLKESYILLKRAPDILRKAAMKVSAQAEQHGCYQQEHRTAANIEVILSYSNYLKSNIQALNQALGECRKQLESRRKLAAAIDSEEAPDLQPTAKGEPLPTEADEQETTGDIIEDEVPRMRFSAVVSTLMKVREFAKMTLSRRSTRDADIRSCISGKRGGVVDHSDVVTPDEACNGDKFRWWPSEKTFNFMRQRRLLLVVFFALLLLVLSHLLFRAISNAVNIDVIWLFEWLRFDSPPTRGQVDSSVDS